MATIANTAPSPEDVDERAIAFNSLEARLTQTVADMAAASEPVKALKLELVELVRNFGSVHAEKSKLLHGIVWEMMATFGQSTSQDAAAVERLRLALVKAKKARLLKILFAKEVRWTLRTQAMTVIKSEKLTPKLMSLVLQCADTKDRTPTLDVREKAPAKK
jgi:hypothetical protein